nr:arsenate reductase ArsC [uncultured Desulfuromonas sp.]
MSKKLNIVFVCEANSCRSQMAEGWAKQLNADAINPFSGGIFQHPIDPRAIQVMDEAGVDISKQETHDIQNFLEKDIDYVVTVCSEAAKQCPTFPTQVKVINQHFDNPPELTREMATEEEKLAVYRRVRDEIRQFVEQLPEKIMP